MNLLVDMDEVLADFVGGAVRAHNWPADQFAQQCPPGTWDIGQAMGLTPEQFWQPIQQLGADFWIRLRVLPWVPQLVKVLDSYPGAETWYVVTTPSRDPACLVGKALWLQRELGIPVSRLITTSCKPLLARRNTILIDDKEDTVNQFTQAGGYGILWPCDRNSLHATSDPVQYVGAMLSVVYGCSLVQSYASELLTATMQNRDKE